MTNEEPITVVKLITTYYQTKDGYAITKKIITQKRLSKGFDFFKEEVSFINVENALTRIINLDECEDGLYELIMINQSKDYETGYIEDWDYKLISYEKTI